MTEPNKYVEWVLKFQELSSFAKANFWRESLKEEADRYQSTPFDLRVYDWKGWFFNRCRLTNEKDVEGYD